MRSPRTLISTGRKLGGKNVSEPLGYWSRVFEESVRLLKEGIPAELAFHRAEREAYLSQPQQVLEGVEK